jgi:hypothetical protein
MYIEHKAGGLTGEGRIGRVRFSRTGRMLYYNGLAFSKVIGYKYNCIEKESGEQYWISGCKTDGSDSLYNTSIPIVIDEDVREEYWKLIRKKPHLITKTKSN